MIYTYIFSNLRAYVSTINHIIEVLLSTSMSPHQLLKQHGLGVSTWIKIHSAGKIPFDDRETCSALICLLDGIERTWYRGEIKHGRSSTTIPTTPSPPEQIDRVRYIKVLGHFNHAMYALRMSLTAKTSSSSISTTVSCLLATLCSIPAYFRVSSPSSCYKPEFKANCFPPVLLNHPCQSNISRGFGVHKRVPATNILYTRASYPQGFQYDYIVSGTNAPYSR